MSGRKEVAFFALHRQHGMVLVVSLILLVLMSLLAIAAINTSITNLKIVRNAQGVYEAEAAIQRALTSFIANNANFLSPPTANTYVDVDINNDTTVDYRVEIPPPVCISFQIPAPLVAVEAMTDANMKIKCKSSAEVASIQCRQKVLDFNGRVVSPADNSPGDPGTGANVGIFQGSGRILSPIAKSC